MVSGCEVPVGWFFRVVDSSTCKNGGRFEREGNFLRIFLKLSNFPKSFLGGGTIIIRFFRLGWCKSLYLHGVFFGLFFSHVFREESGFAKATGSTGICPSNVKGVKCGAIFKLHVKFKVV